MQTGQTEALRLHTRISARPWLDDTSMHYRLQYAHELQVHAYAYARWVAPPAEMLAQRLEQRLARSPDLTRAGTSTVLDVELEEFVQVFDSPDASIGRVTVHAQLGSASPRHATFSEQVRATSPDAAGGAGALAAATDALILRLLQWMDGREGNMTTDDGRPRFTGIEKMLHRCRTPC